MGFRVPKMGIYALLGIRLQYAEAFEAESAVLMPDIDAEAFERHLDVLRVVRKCPF